MKLELIKLYYRPEGDGDYTPILELIYTRRYKDCYATIYSQNIKTEEFADNSNNRFSKIVVNKQSILDVENRLRKISISDREDMISTMLEMIQLTEGYDNYKELLPW